MVVAGEAPCEDATSGAPFPFTVTARLDGRELRGRGRTPSTDTAGATSMHWTLVDPGGTRVATGGTDAHLRLPDDGGRVTGSSGCNTLAGRVARNGDPLRSVVGVAVTRRACLEAALRAQEAAFLRAPSATDRVVVAGDTLTLSDGARTLARFVVVRPR